MLATLRSLAMRRLRGLGLLLLGFYGGFLAATALVKRMFPSRGDADSDEVALVAIRDGVRLQSRAQAFRGGSMLAWFGGVSADLRQATLAPGAHLTASAVFGGIAIEVPAGWRVESTASTLAGGVAVNVPEPEDPAAPTLTVDCMATFGGVAIKVGDAAES